MDRQIKTRPDGSIDTSYYMAQGRVARSDAAHDALRETGNGALRGLGILGGLAVLIGLRQSGA